MNLSASNQPPQVPEKPVDEVTNDEASDLAAQLDALLAREADEPVVEEAPAPAAPAPEASADTSNAVEPGVPPSPPPPENTPDTTPEKTPTAESEPAAPAADETDDIGSELADQIQSLLDEADELQGTFESPQQLEAQAASQADADAESVTDEQTAEDASSDDDAMLIEQIDQMLAHEADESIGELQSVEQVMAEEAIRDEPEPVAAPPAAPEAVADAQAGAADPVEDELAQAEDAIAAELDDEDEWSFESPEGATADDVASELDDQPEARPAGATASAEPAEQDHADDAVVAADVAAWRRGLDRLEWTARHGCALVNRPLDYLGPENRRLIGYAAILMTATNLLVVLIGLMK